MTLKMNTNLYYNNPLAPKPSWYHNEYLYTANRQTSISIKRDFFYYLTLEKYENNTKDSAFITAADILYVREKLKEVTQIFSPNAEIFGKRNGFIVIYKQTQPIVIQLQNGNITFEPVVILNSDNLSEAGVRIILSKGLYTDCNINKFMELVYHINSIDLFTAAQNQINYLGRPANGSNMVTFDNTTLDDVAEENSKIPDRTRKKNFFDL